MAAAKEMKSLPILRDAIQFGNNSRNYARACKWPSRRSVIDQLKGHLIGLGFLGMLGYVIKVVHIPINNIIAGSES